MKTILVLVSVLLSCLTGALATAAAIERNAASASRDAWQSAQYRFTPELEAAFLKEAKAAALKKLAAAGKTLPPDFLAWIDSNPVVKTTVYGARQDATGVLLILRSLELDLGQDVVRQKYTQLALAMAVVHAKDGEKVDLAPRQPLTLIIPGDPRKKVDTHDKTRTLDLDDHIVNFLNDHAPIVEDVVVGHRDAAPESKLDNTGKPIPQRKAKAKQEPITEKRSRPVRAADVIADPALEKEFNEYLKAHGQTVQIHCGDDKRLTWNSHDLKGIDTKGVKETYALFEHAYAAKGFLPPARDPAPSLAERCAYLIRNNEYAMPADKKIAWPRFPLTAPWPVLTLLAADGQPLREREDIWERYRDRGEFHGYGEYVGNIAQSPLYLQARRLAPYPFFYGSVQMMLKDGGVCGTMANIAARSRLSLGESATTAGQPGHCALIYFAFDAKSNTYRCQGGQYVTAGDAGTHPHTSWFFGDVDARKPMVYHQSIAWSVNHGLQSYLDSTVAHTFYKQLSAADRQAHGEQFLQSAIALCPYNFLLADDALDNTANPAELIAFWNALKPALAAGKPGCPADGLYNTTVKERLFVRLAALPVPGDRSQVVEVQKFLSDEECENQATLAAYKVAADGLPALLADAAAAFKSHLASVRNDASCVKTAETLSAAADKIADKKQRREWSLGLWQQVQGKEKYFGRKNRLAIDPCVPLLAKLSGQKPRPETEQLQSILDQVADRLRTSVDGARSPTNCKQLAAEITAAAAEVKDDAQKRQWAATLSKTIAGRELYQVQTKKKPQTVRDPCAEAIAQLVNLQPAASPK